MTITRADITKAQDAMITALERCRLASEAVQATRAHQIQLTKDLILLNNRVNALLDRFEGTPKAKGD